MSEVALLQTARKLLSKLALVLALAFALADPVQFCAQSAATPPKLAAALPSFDVISVKPNNSNKGGGNLNRLDDGLHITDFPLMVLVRIAYNLDFDGQMINLPEWTKQANYDIDARVAAGDVAKFKKLNRVQLEAMLQQILTDRFKLTVHHESRQLPVYNLVLAKNGPKPALKQVNADLQSYYVRNGDNQISMHSRPVTEFATVLAIQLHRTVIDKTGLTGNYDLELKFTPDFADPAMAQADKEAAEASARNGDDTEAPTLFTAIQEQLGLKLVSAKGPVDCIVIDHIERPSEK